MSVVQPLFILLMLSGHPNYQGCSGLAAKCKIIAANTYIGIVNKCNATLRTRLSTGCSSGMLIRLAVWVLRAIHLVQTSNNLHVVDENAWA